MTEVVHSQIKSTGVSSWPSLIIMEDVVIGVVIGA